MFTTRPQDVEVYQAGAWWPGALLGWRHDATGDCQVWVRVVIGGVEETAWTDLSTLRLPERSSEPHLAMAPSLSATEQLKVAAGRMSAPEPADAPATRALPAVRAAAAPSVPAQRSGGRRRAPEPATAEFSLPETPVAVPLPGRHRVAAGAGGVDARRHRASDIGVWAGVPSDTTGRVSGPTGSHSAARTLRPPVAERVAPGGRRRAAAEVEPDLLTRPMRLDDLAPRPRKPQLDGFLTKA